MKNRNIINCLALFSRAALFDSARLELTYIVESCNDFSNPVGWTTIVTNPGSVGQLVSVIDNASPNTSLRFLRVKFVR